MLTTGLAALGMDQAVNPFQMTTTVFSGADPALADLAGTGGIMQGTYPQSYNQSLLASWASSAPRAGGSGNASLGDQLLQLLGPGFGPPTQPAPSTTKDVSNLTKATFFVIALVLLLAGAFAIVGPSNAAAAAAL
jgi:hypothetical protein